MKITIVIPVIDEHHVTKRCLEKIKENSVTDPRIIIIDNNSKEPFIDTGLANIFGGDGLTRSNPRCSVIRFLENQGMLGSLKIGLDQCSADEILVYPHNDVLIHEKGWDKRVIDAFEKDPLLGMAGFFGARGVGKDGGRWHSESAMMGKEWGTSYVHHSALSTKVTPAAIFDGLCLIFRVGAVYKRSDESQDTVLPRVLIPDGPPHHWYDRFLPLEFISRGWRCATIGILHDHAGGLTASKQGYSAFAHKWCEERGLEATSGSHDLTIYNEGLKIFNEKWAPKLPLKVDDQYNYTWNSK